MAKVRRSRAFMRRGISSLQVQLILLVLVVFVTLLLYLILVVPESNVEVKISESAHIYHEELHVVEERLRSTVQRKREQLAKALGSLSTSSSSLPGRLKKLRAKNEIVGERLQEITIGGKTVQEIIHAAGSATISQ